jgi:hypothetical protein
MKIVELKITSDDELTGMDAVALVSQPAIEHGFYHFNDQNIEEYIFESIVEDVVTEKKNDETVGTEEGVSQEFSHFEDLPIGTQERMLETLASKGISNKQLESDGYIIIGEEDFGKQLGFNVTSNDAKPDLPTTDTAGSFKILYKYKGPRDNKNRDFCQRMLGLDLLFRKEDIQRLTMKGANSEFGYYDIFQYKGSFGCRHRWTKVYTYQKKSLLPEAAAILNDQIARSRENLTKETFAQVGDKQVCAGPLMIPNKLIFRVDENNDPYFVYFSEETVRMIAKKLMESNYLDSVNLEHDPERPVNGQMITTNPTAS